MWPRILPTIAARPNFKTLIAYIYGTLRKSFTGYAETFHRKIQRFSKANQIKIMNEVEEKAYELFAAISKIEVAIMFKSEIPNAKIMELTTLMCDYNEALKKEKDGSAKIH